MKRIRHVLCASDFSTASRHAFATAVTMAQSLDAKLTIIHVIAPIIATAPEQYVDAVTLDQLSKQERQWGAEQLEKLAARARKAGVRAATLLRDGDPSEQILRASRSTKADIVVLGTHGRRGLSKLILGSVAARLVATALCPVVTVRSK
ncbi:MAG: universal stress protein [Vicinamibacterales bacterium]